MRNAIIDNIEHLYRSHIIIAVLFFVLIVVVSLITVGVIKRKLHHAKWKSIALVVFAVSASVVLLISQIVAISPVYKDYTEQSYIVIENAKVIINDGATGGIDSINYVTVYDGEKQIELKMQTDYSLDTEFEYIGKIAYLEHSNFLIWYDFD